jgi:putative SOS response-associated peptidase YedK
MPWHGYRLIGTQVDLFVLEASPKAFHEDVVAPRRPHYIHKRDGSPMALAGIWETWKGPDETIESCAIITTAPNALMATLHNRMPVILDPAHFDWWMTGSTEEVGQLLVPCPPEELGAYPISRRVNNPRNEGPELRRPAA